MTAILYWLVMCFARRRDARKDISYRQYMPLKAKTRRGRRATWSRSAHSAEESEEEEEGEKEEDEDDHFGIGNAEEGHLEAGHWLRNLLGSRDNTLR